MRKFLIVLSATTLFGLGTAPLLQPGSSNYTDDSVIGSVSECPTGWEPKNAGLAPAEDLNGNDTICGSSQQELGGKKKTTKPKKKKA